MTNENLSDLTRTETKKQYSDAELREWKEWAEQYEESINEEQIIFYETLESEEALNDEPDN